MDSFLKEAVVLIFLGFGVSLGLNFLMIHLGPRLGLMDQPGERRVHSTPVARAGGIAIWSCFLAITYLGKACLPQLFNGGISDYFNAFAISSALLMFVGVIDDRQGLPAIVKLLGQIAAALLFAVLKPGVQGSLFGHEIPGLLDVALFVIWTVLLINSFNLIDGLDGLCGGLTCISLIVVAGLALAESHFSNAIVIGLMAASVLGFLCYNSNPAQIFLGDAGSMMLGFFLATAATQSGGRRAIVGSILLPIAIAGVPFLDVLLAIWRRSARNLINQLSGGPKVGIFSPDKEHLHHRLLASGNTQARVGLLLQTLAALLAVLAFIPVLAGGRGIAVSVIGLVVLGLFGLRHVAQVELRYTGSLIHLAVKRRTSTVGFRKWYFVYDALVLLIAGSAALVIETNMWVRNYDKQWLVGFLTSFLACEIVALHLLKIYHRVWLRSALVDFLKVSLALVIGGIVSCSIFQFATGELAWRNARAGVIAVSMATWLVLLPRALPDIVRELAMDSAHRRLTRRRDAGKQVLVYGAGDMGNLFIKYLKNSNPAEYHGFQISGFLDDNPLLKGRMVNGFPIHGGLEMLKSITSKYQLHGIIVAIHQLSEENLRKIREIAAQMRLAVYVWSPDLSPRRILSGFTPSSELQPGPLLRSTMAEISTVK
jgi:UDP-N-acetylmuramyl pentapeptide phosphotransferase/UDP-N-acetylglucosamine-1-phosphate transferase